jgi:hypothetical protein
MEVSEVHRLRKEMEVGIFGLISTFEKTSGTKVESIDIWRLTQMGREFDRLEKVTISLSL